MPFCFRRSKRSTKRNVLLAGCVCLHFVVLTQAQEVEVESIIVTSSVSVLPADIFTETESVQISDSVIISPVTILVVTEEIQVSDESVPTTTTILTISESIDVADNNNNTPTTIITISEPIRVAGDVIPAATTILTISESVEVLDVMIPSPTTLLVVNESIQVSDFSYPLLEVKLTVSEGINVNDVSSAIQDVKLLINESISVQENLNHAIARPPQVSSVRTIASLCAPGKMELTGAVTELEIMFSEPMIVTEGEDGSIGAGELSNYRLLGSSSPSSLLTLTCSGILPDGVREEELTIHGYLASDRAVVLRTRSQSGLEVAYYRFMACSDGLKSTVGLFLDGNADGTEGGDYAIGLSIRQSNLLSNPNFSNSSESWNLLETASYSTEDADNAILAGSIYLDHSIGDAGLNQCVDLNDTRPLLLGASFFAEPGEGGTRLGIEYFELQNCEGLSLGASTTQAIEGTGEWKAVSLPSSVPRDSSSALFYVINEPASLPVHVDRTYLVALPNFIFSSGFETGSGSVEGRLCEAPD